MRIHTLLLAAAPLMIAVPAQAQDSAVASTQIAQGDYNAAETKLLAEMRIHPDWPELMLNLAAVYAKTGRSTQARALYTKVLSQDDVLMDLGPDRTAGSHAIAQTGLQRINTVQFTSR